MCDSKENKIILEGYLNNTPIYWQNFVMSLTTRAGPTRAEQIKIALEKKWNASIDKLRETIDGQHLEIVFPDQESKLAFILEWS